MAGKYIAARIQGGTKACREFMLAGNATFTLVSKKTEKRYTYKIRVCDENNELFFVSVMFGADNENDFAYIGTIRSGINSCTGGIFSPGRKSKVLPNDIRVQAFSWFWQCIREGRMSQSLEVWHEGKCGRCGRKLTVPESIKRGIGPECMKHSGSTAQFEMMDQWMGDEQ